MKYFHIFFLFLFSLLLEPLYGSNDLHLNFTQISTRNGLSQNTVRTIIGDEKGFIWAGTLGGLDRYDGYNIVSFRPQNLNHTELADYRVRDIFRDSRGYLWIKTFKDDFDCYDPVRETFLSLDCEPMEPGALQQTHCFESSSGDIWLWGNSHNCRRISPGDSQWRNTFFSTNGSRTRFVIEDSRGEIWTGGDYGIYLIKGDSKEAWFTEDYQFTRALETGGMLYFTSRQSVIAEYDPNRKSFREYRKDDFPLEFTDLAQIGPNELLLSTARSGVWVFDLARHIFHQPDWTRDPQLTGQIEFITDKLGGVWIYNNTGTIWYYNPIGGKVKKQELIPQEVMSVIDMERYNILVDSQGLIWITTYGNGLFCYTPRTEHFQHFGNSSEPNSPAWDYLLSITEDRAGNIWIGTEYSGIIKVVKSPYIHHLFLPESQGALGKNNNIRSVYIDPDEQIWLGTKNGSLYRYDRQLSGNPYVISGLNPYCMLQDSKERLWVGTKTNGVQIFDRQGLHRLSWHRNDPHDEASISHNSVYALLEDSKYRMWIATYGGGICLAEETAGGMTFRRFNFGHILRNNIRFLMEDSNNVIWAGTNDGLLRFDPEKLYADPSAYQAFRIDPDQPGGINSSDIKTIYQDSRRRLWIGTAGGGISQYIDNSDGKPGRFVAYTEKDGLAGNFVSGIQEDDSGKLWISTESGMSRFDPESGTFNIYHFSEKTYGSYFNDNAHDYDSEGNMYWGTLEGVLVFHPEYFGSPEPPLPVTFTNFFIYDQKAEVGPKDAPLCRSISYADEIRLNHSQNTFTIEFSTLSYKDRTPYRYTYLLENFDKQWSMVSGDNKANYKNLPPGHYTFRIKGTNNDGTWNEQTSSLEIYIAPPWWKSLWAYGIYTLLLAALLVLIYRLFKNFNRLHNNVRVEKELTNHKLRFFTNISHEFRTPLTIIRGMIDNLTRHPDIPDTARRQIAVLNRNSNMLNQLIDQLLEFRKLQNNIVTLDLENIDMVDFVHDIFQGFTEIAGQKEITYTFDCARESFDLFIDRRKMDKVVYNLLSNAFKFTPAGGEITLRLSFDDDFRTCLIAVEDNGPGIEPEKREMLFSRFMQTHFSYEGTGVGLSLVKEFVVAHKGRVWYTDNTRTGHGSVFSVELSTDRSVYQGENFVTPGHLGIELNNEPVPARSQSNVEVVEMPEIDDATLSGYKMLIIDDNDDIRNFLADEFSRYFMVESAVNGEKGLQMASDCSPDLIICDVMMTGMDGFEVTRQLREDFQTCHIPIILLTAHSSLEHQVEGIQSGADAYITKPFSMDYLTARVFKLIEQREQLKKRFSTEYVVGGNLVGGTDRDKKFLDLLNRIMEENLADPEFSVIKFGRLAGQGRSIFYKKVKGITGLSPNDFIKSKRLQRAAEILVADDYTVAEVGYKVGFDDPFYFSKCFKAHFDCSPSKYRNKLAKDSEEQSEDTL